jgi:hypothetical protein
VTCEEATVWDDLERDCLFAVLEGGATWQRFKADAEQRLGLTWPEIKERLNEQHAKAAA